MMNGKRTGFKDGIGLASLRKHEAIKKRNPHNEFSSCSSIIATARSMNSIADTGDDDDDVRSGSQSRVLP
jgi:hypothetical protein